MLCKFVCAAVVICQIVQKWCSGDQQRSKGKLNQCEIQILHFGMKIIGFFI